MSPSPEPSAARSRPARRSLLVWTLAAGGGALLTFAVLAAVEALADLSAAVHLMA